MAAENYNFFSVTSIQLEESEAPWHCKLEWNEQKWFFTLSQYCRGIKKLPAKDRLQWLASLKLWLLDSPDIKMPTVSKIIEFSSLLCDWHFILKIYQQYPEYIIWSQGSVENENNAIEQLSYATWKKGKWQEAYEFLEKHMFRSPKNKNIYLLYCYLLDLARGQGLDNYYRSYVSESLCLEPLSSHHVDEFFWQYWDPEIARLCCLPMFNSTNDWQLWLTQQQSFDDQLTFGVKHKTEGFIGVVSLIIHNGVAFFYYWLGKDYQNRKLGRQAASLLLELGAECFGVTSFYAKVFEHNIASKKAIQNLGFQPLPVSVAKPNKNEAFYYLGGEKTDKEKCFELAELFINMRSTTTLEIPIKWLIK